MSFDLSILCKAGFGRTARSVRSAKKGEAEVGLGRRSRETTDAVAPPQRSADGGETRCVCAP